MVKGQTYSNQLFENWAYRLTLDTLLDGNNGILNQYGDAMEVTSSSNNIIVASGLAIVQGGIIENTSDLTLTPQLEANTYYRVVIEIDMSQTNTTSEFNQGSIKLISNTGDYPALTTQDTIRGTGIYQYELARFNTTSSAIQNLTDARTYLNYNSLYQELRDAIEEIVQGGITASDVSYDNTNSGLNADDTQEGLDALASAIGVMQTTISNLQSAVAGTLKSTNFETTTLDITLTTNIQYGESTKQATATKNGYKPLGVVGFYKKSTSNGDWDVKWARPKTLSNGSATIETSGASIPAHGNVDTSCVVTTYILWVKIT